MLQNKSMKIFPKNLIMGFNAEWNKNAEYGP
jgi:hypothetical protein